MEFLEIVRMIDIIDIRLETIENELDIQRSLQEEILDVLLSVNRRDLKNQFCDMWKLPKENE